MAHKSLTKAIAKELIAGNICYVHRENRKITAIVDLEEGMKDTPERQAKVEKLEAKIKKYYKVTRMTSDEELHVMMDFVEDELALSIRRELINALKRKNPKRNFMRIIDNHEEIREYWPIFKFKWYQEWVRGYLLDIYQY